MSARLLDWENIWNVFGRSSGYSTVGFISQDHQTYQINKTQSLKYENYLVKLQLNNY